MLQSNIKLTYVLLLLFNLQRRVKMTMLRTMRRKLEWRLTQVGGRKEGNVLFNDALNTFYLRLYG